MLIDYYKRENISYLFNNCQTTFASFIRNNDSFSGA